MTWLKLVVNALWTGLYGAVLVAFLFFFLHGEVADAGLLSRNFGFILLWALLLYTWFFALLFPTLYVCLRFFAARRLQIPWIGLNTIVWPGDAVLLVVTFVYYLNLRLVGALLSPSSRDALRILCTTMAVCWLLAVTGAALAQRRQHERRTAHRVVAGLLILVPVVVMTFMAPFMTTSTGPVIRVTPSTDSQLAGSPVPYGPKAPEPRLLFVGLDAATMDVVLPLVSARQLPTFENLIKAGTSARLDSLRPCSPVATWTAVMTGMPPWITGVRGRDTFVLHPGPGEARPFGIVPATLGMQTLARLGLISSQPIQESGGSQLTMRRILERLSIPAKLIGWEKTARGQGNPVPIEPDSERVSYRIGKILGPAHSNARDVHAALDRVLRQAIAADLSALDAAEQGRNTRLLAVRFQGLASVSRSVLRYHEPLEFGDVSGAEVELFGPILGRYYAFLDEMIGELIQRVGSDGTPMHVMVVSAYGIVAPSGWG